MRGKTRPKEVRKNKKRNGIGNVCLIFSVTRQLNALVTRFSHETPLFSFQAEIFSGKTDLGSNDISCSTKRDPSHSLAKINVQVMRVEGTLNISGALKANAFLQDMVLEDSR